MRLVIQRVSGAQVTVDGNVESSIGEGMLVFAGIEKGDDESAAVKLAAKVSALRMFEDPAGKMNLSIREKGGMALVVSQFTLAADLSRGNRPGFDSAEEPERAKRLIERFVQALAEKGIQVRQGIFGATMDVALTNSGPVTFIF